MEGITVPYDAYASLRAWSQYAPRARAALPTLVGTRFLRDRKYVLRSDSGCLFAVEPTDFGTYLAMLRGGPNYPSHVFEVCRRHLDRHGVLYDVGANVGYVSMEIARSDLHDVRVFAFEPSSQLAEKLHDIFTDGKGGLGEIVRLDRAEDSRSDDVLAVPPGGRVVQAP